MANTKNIDAAAAKQRKQKIMLGVIGAVLVLLGAIQGPKLMKQLSGGPATPAAAAPTDTTATAGGAPPAATATAAVPALVGASVPASPQADPTQGKLISFSLFATKDPFVPQVSTKPAADAAASAVKSTTPPADTGTGTPPDVQATTPAGQATTPAGSGTAAAAPEQPPLTDATLVINGAAEYLKLKGTFPASDPVFELKVIKPKTVKIGVAGGAFTDGKLLVLKMDKGITLVNTATGARYKITLVYTGLTPEKVESFTAGSPSGDAAAQAATGSSTVDVSASK